MPAASALINLLKDRGPVTGIEIGVFKGESARDLLTHLPLLTLHGVDPYTPYIDWDTTSTHNDDNAYNQALQVEENFKDRFFLHRFSSNEIPNRFEDNAFDYIFIDGLHTYDQVILDYNNYNSKVKPGGIISGHDYKTVNDVKRAVDEIAQALGKNVLHLDNDVWYWIKD